MPYNVNSQGIQPNAAAAQMWGILAQWLMKKPAATPASGPTLMNALDYEEMGIKPAALGPVDPPAYAAPGAKFEPGSWMSPSWLQPSEDKSAFDYNSWFAPQTKVEGGGYNVNLPPKKEPNSY